MVKKNYGLGRIVEHDPASRAFPAHRAGKIQTVHHVRNVPIFDQGELGSCTGNAAAGCLMTDPFFQAGESRFTEDDAVKLYSRATHLDRAKGVYPPDDTGSSGLAVAKACKEAGLITSYHHAFGFEHALEALTFGPVIAGVNWYESFFSPSMSGECRWSETSAYVGGHEICLVSIDTDRERVGFANSWGRNWGVDGYAYFSFATFEKLLAQQGDVTVLVR